jgi:predicted deacylase
LPIVVYLGYSIHGNESSGTGAAIALAYYLAAAESPARKTLEKTIILLDLLLLTQTDYTAFPHGKQ